MLLVGSKMGCHVLSRIGVIPSDGILMASLISKVSLGGVQA